MPDNRYSNPRGCKGESETIRESWEISGLEDGDSKYVEHEKGHCYSCGWWCLGAVSTDLEKWFEKTGIEVRVEHLQKTALLGTARILRMVLMQ